MELSTLITVSCVLTGITMVFFVAGIAFLMRYGGKGVKAIIDRFMGGGGDKKEADTVNQPQRSAATSRQSFRQRAQSLDFPAPAGAQQFSAQGLGQQGQYPDFQQQQPSLTPRMGQGQFGAGGQVPQAQSFRPSTPSLSPSRPFNAGFTQQQPPQQGGLGQQGGFNAQSQGGLRQSPPLQQGGFQQQAPQQGYGQQQQPPQQGGLRQSPPLQQGGFQQQAPQQNYGQQQPPQQGGLGQNRPPLQSRPRPDDSGGRQFSPGRDNRRHDDYDRIYDDGGDGGDLGGLGDILDGF